MVHTDTEAQKISQQLDWLQARSINLTVARRAMRAVGGEPTTEPDRRCRHTVRHTHRIAEAASHSRDLAAVPGERIINRMAVGLVAVAPLLHVAEAIASQLAAFSHPIELPILEVCF